jgi:hypothetical protein
MKLFLTPRKAHSEWWLAYEPAPGQPWVYVHGPYTRKSDARKVLKSKLKETSGG